MTNCTLRMRRADATYKEPIWYSVITVMDGKKLSGLRFDLITGIRTGNANKLSTGILF